MGSRNPLDPGYLCLLCSTGNHNHESFYEPHKIQVPVLYTLDPSSQCCFNTSCQMAAKHSHHQIRLTPDYIQPFLCQTCPLICMSHWLAFAHILSHTAFRQFLLHLLTYRSLLFPAFPRKLPVTSTDKQLSSKYFFFFFFPVVVLTLLFLIIFHGKWSVKWYNQY